MDKNTFHPVDNDDRPDLIDFGNEEFISALLVLWSGGKETLNQFGMAIHSEYVPGYYHKYAFNHPQWVDLDGNEVRGVTHWMQPDISGES